MSSSWSESSPGPQQADWETTEPLRVHQPLTRYGSGLGGLLSHLHFIQPLGSRSLSVIQPSLFSSDSLPAINDVGQAFRDLPFFDQPPTALPSVSSAPAPPGSSPPRSRRRSPEAAPTGLASPSSSTASPLATAADPLQVQTPRRDSLPPPTSTAALTPTSTATTAAPTGESAAGTGADNQDPTPTTNPLPPPEPAALIQPSPAPEDDPPATAAVTPTATTGDHPTVEATATPPTSTIGSSLPPSQPEPTAPNRGDTQVQRTVSDPLNVPPVDGPAAATPEPPAPRVEEQAHPATADMPAIAENPTLAQSPDSSPQDSSESSLAGAAPNAAGSLGRAPVAATSPSADSPPAIQTAPTPAVLPPQSAPAPGEPPRQQTPQASDLDEASSPSDTPVTAPDHPGAIAAETALSLPEAPITTPEPPQVASGELDLQTAPEPGLAAAEAPPESPPGHESASDQFTPAAVSDASPSSGATPSAASTAAPPTSPLPPVAGSFPAIAPEPLQRQLDTPPDPDAPVPGALASPVADPDRVTSPSAPLPKQIEGLQEGAASPPDMATAADVTPEPTAAPIPPSSPPSAIPVPASASQPAPDPLEPAEIAPAAQPPPVHPNESPQPPMQRRSEESTADATQEADQPPPPGDPLSPAAATDRLQRQPIPEPPPSAVETPPIAAGSPTLQTALEPELNPATARAVSPKSPPGEEAASDQFIPAAASDAVSPPRATPSATSPSAPPTPETGSSPAIAPEPLQRQLDTSPAPDTLAPRALVSPVAAPDPVTSPSAPQPEQVEGIQEGDTSPPDMATAADIPPEPTVDLATPPSPLAPPAPSAPPDPADLAERAPATQPSQAPPDASPQPSIQRRSEAPTTHATLEPSSPAAATDRRQQQPMAELPPSAVETPPMAAGDRPLPSPPESELTPATPIESSPESTPGSGPTPPPLEASSLEIVPLPLQRQPDASSQSAPPPPDHRETHPQSLPPTPEAAPDSSAPAPEAAAVGDASQGTPAVPASTPPSVAAGGEGFEPPVEPDITTDQALSQPFLTTDATEQPAVTLPSVVQRLGVLTPLRSPPDLLPTRDDSPPKAGDPEQIPPRPTPPRIASSITPGIQAWPLVEPTGLEPTGLEPTGLEPTSEPTGTNLTPLEIPQGQELAPARDESPESTTVPPDIPTAVLGESARESADTEPGSPPSGLSPGPPAAPPEIPESWNSIAELLTQSAPSADLPASPQGPSSRWDDSGLPVDADGTPQGRDRRVAPTLPPQDPFPNLGALDIPAPPLIQRQPAAVTTSQPSATLIQRFATDGDELSPEQYNEVSGVDPDTGDSSESLEKLAQVMYRMVRQRLAIERERLGQFGSSRFQ